MCWLCAPPKSSAWAKPAVEVGCSGMAVAVTHGEGEGLRTWEPWRFGSVQMGTQWRRQSFGRQWLGYALREALWHGGDSANRPGRRSPTPGIDGNGDAVYRAHCRARCWLGLETSGPYCKGKARVCSDGNRGQLERERKTPCDEMASDGSGGVTRSSHERGHGREQLAKTGCGKVRAAAHRHSSVSRCDGLLWQGEAGFASS